MANKLIQLKDGNDNVYPTNFVKILNNTNDLNDLFNIQDSGFYLLQGGVAHSPQDWCALLVIGGLGAHQIAYNANAIWIRSFTGSPLAWTSWRQI